MLELKRNNLKAVVTQQLRRQRTSDAGIIQIRIPVGQTDPLAWLRRQATWPHWFWQARGENVYVAGAGVVHQVDTQTQPDLDHAIAAMQQVLADSDETIRYVGGMAFDPYRTPTGPWMDFDRFFFFVPQVQLELCNGQAVLAFQCLRSHSVTAESVLAELDALTAMPNQAQTTTAGRIQSDIQVPNQEQWCPMVRDVLSRLDKQSGKLVPACRRNVIAERRLDPHDILARLRAAGQDAYQFLLGFEGAAFLGRSPELLYQRHGRKLCSEALAGTSQGASEETLLESAKDNTEQDYVIRDLQEAMGQICNEVRVSSGKEVVTWGRLVHLKSSLHGRLKPGLGDAAILQALHPTAAVLGYPRQQAWELLQAFETIHRGWYAGPIGWVARDRAEFAVAIRSALCHGKTLEIYAGAGIVKGSDPEQEFDEICNKMKPYIDLFVK